MNSHEIDNLIAVSKQPVRWFVETVDGRLVKFDVPVEQVELLRRCLFSAKLYFPPNSVVIVTDRMASQLISRHRAKDYEKAVSALGSIPIYRATQQEAVKLTSILLDYRITS